MADPHRLLDDPDGSPLGRALLSSAASDAPTPDGRATAAKRLGLAAAAVAAGSGKAGGAVVAGALWWKLGALALLVGGAVAIAVTRESSPPPPPPPPSIAPAPQVVVPKPAVPTAEVIAPAPEVVAPGPEVAVQPVEDPKPKRVREPRPARASVVPVPVPEPPAAQPEPEPEVAAEEPTPPAEQVDPRRLAAEVAILDRARAALRAGDTTAALAALDEHQRTFADGSLLAAAEVVRIEALLQRRDVATARAYAEAFLAHHPQSPLARRVRSLLDRIAKEAP